MGLLTLLNIGRHDRASAQNEASRPAKARRIADFLATARPLDGARILDYGAGRGIIARELSAAVGPAGEVVAADISDKRQDHSTVFIEVDERGVPEPDASFDAIVSNHVLEHVGPVEAQARYLAECRRLLREDGMMYLAMPSRWTAFEPHYRLPFISWWPEDWRSGYLRVLRRLGLKAAFSMPMDHYPIWPHSRARLRQILRQAGFEPTDITRDSVRRAIELEMTGPARPLMLILMPVAYVLFWPLIPTHVFLCRPKNPPRPG